MENGHPTPGWRESKDEASQFHSCAFLTAPNAGAHSNKVVQADERLKENLNGPS